MRSANPAVWSVCKCVQNAVSSRSGLRASSPRRYASAARLTTPGPKSTRYAWPSTTTAEDGPLAHGQAFGVPVPSKTSFVFMFIMPFWFRKQKGTSLGLSPVIELSVCRFCRGADGLHAGGRCAHGAAASPAGRSPARHRQGRSALRGGRGSVCPYRRFQAP